MAFFDTKGGRIYYETAGKGNGVLFIHAGIADSRMWDWEFEHLAKDFFVLRLDLPGYGFSEQNGEDYSYKEILKELLDHLNIKKVHIVAASYGGKIAMDFALSHKDYCRSLALISPALSGWEESKFLQAYEIEEARLLEVRAFETAAELNYFTWILGGRKPEEVSEEIKEKVIDMQMKAFIKAEAEFAGEPAEEPDLINRLKELQLPLLVFIGDRDVIDFQMMADRICAEAPDVQKVVVENAGHLSNLEMPELFAKTLEEFIKHEV